MAAVVGQLRVLLSADSAQIVSDLGKARTAVRTSSAAMASDGRRAMDVLTAEFGKVGPAIRGTQPAVTAVMQSFMLLGRTVPPQIGGITNALASLVGGGFTPVGIALAAVTAGIGLFASAQSDATEKTDAHTAALKAQADRMKELADAAAKAELRARAGLTGKDVDLQGIDEGLEDARQRIASGRRQLAALPAYAQTHGAMQEEIRREIAAAEADLRRLGLERELVLRRIRAERPPRERRVYDPAEEKRRTDEILALLAKARGESPTTPEQPTTQPKADGPAVSPTVAALRAEVEQIQRTIADRREALKVIRGWGTETEVALQSAREAFENARQGGAASDELGAMADRIAGLRQLLDLERQEAEARKALSDQEAAGKAAKDRAEEDRKAAEERERRAREFAGKLAEVESDLAFDLVQGDRTETERRVAEFGRRYEALLEEARAFGLSTLDVEKMIAEGQARIRAQAAADEERDAARRRDDAASSAVTGPDLTEGFRARVTQLREETAGWGRLGAQLADVAANDLSAGVARALEEVARGSRSASEAFREFAANFALEVARMIQQALIMKAILSLFPGLASGAGGAGAGAAGTATAAAPAATAAHGGAFRVGGFGGLDSQLVAMKVSPGELIRVTDGANSAGRDGDVHVALTVRPPAVIADDVMARASPEARAAIVGSALRRPGRRGARARD